jgi:hypothetical protein
MCETLNSKLAKTPMVNSITRVEIPGANIWLSSHRRVRHKACALGNYRCRSPEFRRKVTFLSDSDTDASGAFLSNHRA